MLKGLKDPEETPGQTLYIEMEVSKLSCFTPDPDETKKKKVSLGEEVEGKWYELMESRIHNKIRRS